MTHVILNEMEFIGSQISFGFHAIQSESEYSLSVSSLFLFYLFVGLFSDKQGDQNNSKFLSNLLSNPEEREHLTLELLRNITEVALIHMTVLKQSLCSRGCGASISKTYTFVYI